MQQKIEKARELRYRKPIVKNLNLDFIEQDLWDIQTECEEVRWYTDSDNGEDSLLNALIGDEDEAYEFKMMFADLCAECNRMESDLEEQWVPECFDIFLHRLVLQTILEDYLDLILMNKIILAYHLMNHSRKMKQKRN